MSQRLARPALFTFLFILMAFAWSAPPARAATPLESKQMEWGFAFSWTDTDDVGSATNLDGDWQWILDKKGHHELGGRLSYFKFDPDGGDSTDGMTLGPLYTWNWFPEKPLTGYVSGFLGFVSGDLGDVVDDEIEAAVGGKAFVGDAAAIRFEFFVQRLFGADGFDDQDSHGIRAGLSIFTGRKR